MSGKQGAGKHPTAEPPPARCRVGCAGWSLSSAVGEHFPTTGTHLERYARVFPAVEINYSEYSEPYLEELAVELAGHERAGRRVWCIFDNTAEGAAIPNALSLMRREVQHALAP